MATFPRPTFTELLERIQGDIDARLNNADSKLRRSILNVLSYVLAGAAYGAYGFIAWVALQVFPDTAEVEYLNRWGSIWGVTRTPAIVATGSVVFTGVDTTNIPSGTELLRSDSTVFVTTADGVIASGTATIAVEASVPGANGNTEAASELTFVSPIINVDNVATVDTGGLAGGTDLESDDSYLARILDRIQSPPQGGSETDYEQWALEVSGVTRVWVYPLELGLGSVTVRFCMDDTYDDGIPESGDVTNVQNYIDTKKPVTASVTVVAPVAVPQNFTIHLIDGDTSDIRDAVEAALVDMIRRDAQPGGTLYLSRINEAISLATGVFAHTLAVPSADVTNSTGNITTMGTITWS